MIWQKSYQYHIMDSTTDNALLVYLIWDRKDSSTYLAECDERMAFISGFNGSAGVFFRAHFRLFIYKTVQGCAVITADISVYGWRVFPSGGTAVGQVSQTREPAVNVRSSWSSRRNWTRMKQGLPGKYLLQYR
jgi:hypothetical protein